MVQGPVRAATAPRPLRISFLLPPVVGGARASGSTREGSLPVGRSSAVASVARRPFRAAGPVAPSWALAPLEPSRAGGTPGRAAGRLDLPLARLRWTVSHSRPRSPTGSPVSDGRSCRFGAASVPRRRETRRSERSCFLRSRPPGLGDASPRSSRSPDLPGLSTVLRCFERLLSRWGLSSPVSTRRRCAGLLGRLSALLGVVCGERWTSTPGCAFRAARRPQPLSGPTGGAVRAARSWAVGVWVPSRRAIETTPLSRQFLTVSIYKLLKLTRST